MSLEWFKRKANISRRGSASEIGGDKNSRKIIKCRDCETVRESNAIRNMENFNTRSQYLVALTTNIIALSVGASVGWASPFLPVLQSDESPLNEVLTASQTSWVGSILALGALVGTLLFGYLSEALGRFWSLLLTAFPGILWWLAVIFGSSVEILLAGRFLSGLSAGGVFVLVPLYVSEISEDRVRGILGSFFIFSINLGTLLMFVAGDYLDYSLAAKFMIALPIAFVVTFMFLPETPRHLLRCGKAKEAERALKYLRGCSHVEETPEKIKSELLEMSLKLDEETNVKRESIFTEIGSPASRRALIIGLVLVAVNQLSGCFAFINYTADIFMESGSSLSPNMSAIIVAVIQVAGSTVSTFAIAGISRKLLYALTSFGVMIGLFTMGLHGYLKQYYDISNFAWVPIASLSFVIFVASIGLLPLTFIMLSEILPQKIRSFGVSFCTAVLWTFSFLLLRYFATLVNLLQLYVCMFIFCGFVFLGIAFVVLFVPETRNRSNEEIEKSLRK